MAYSVFPHVSGRIDRFITGEGDTYQVDMGREALVRGGWFGQGPGEGSVKAQSCPTAIPISSLPWPARNSASSPA